MSTNTGTKIIGAVALIRKKTFTAAALVKNKIVELAVPTGRKIADLLVLVRKKAVEADAATRRKIIIAATILIAVLFTGGSYLTGRSTEQTFRDSMEEMARYGVKVTLVDYRRGIFSTSARTELLARFENQPVTLTFNHSIRHGPVLSFASAASIRSELQPSPEIAALFAGASGGVPFDGKGLLTIKTTFGLGGKIHSRIISPKLKIAEQGQARLAWGGLKGEFSVNSARSEIKVKVATEGLTLTGANGHEFRMGRGSFQSSMMKTPHAGLVLDGTSDLVLDSLAYRGGDEAAGGGRSFTFENARVETDASHKDNGTLDMKIRLEADAVVTKDQSEVSVGKPGATFLFESVDVRALDAIVRAALGGDEGQHPVLALEEQADVLVARQPAFSVTDARGEWAEGVTAGSLRFAYTGNGNLERFSLADLAVDVQLTMPIALLTRWLEEQSARGGAKVTEKQVAMINALIDRGAMTGAEGVLSVDASLEGGSLIMNDRQEPLETLQEALEFF